MAEIMFETFSCPSACFLNPAFPAVANAWNNGKRFFTTACVVHFGVNTTDIVPVIDGRLLQDNVRKLNYGGTDVTEFIADILKDRELTIPPEDRLQTARYIKENYCRAIQNESYTFNNFDAHAEKYIIKATGISSSTGKQFSYEVGYERFLAPSIYNHPEMIKKDSPYSVPQAVCDSILNCPKKDQRNLLENIVFSGGSSMFKLMDTAMQYWVQEIADNNFKSSIVPNANCHFNVCIHANKTMAYGEWLKASSFGPNSIFRDHYIDHWQYMEEGLNHIIDLE